MKFVILPVIIRATGIVTKGLKEDLEAIPGKHSIDSLHNTAVLGTSHRGWKVQQSNLEPQQLGSTLVQSHTGEKRHVKIDSIIIIIIIIIHQKA